MGTLLFYRGMHKPREAVLKVLYHTARKWQKIFKGGGINSYNPLLGRRGMHEIHMQRRAQEASVAFAALLRDAGISGIFWDVAKREAEARFLPRSFWNCGPERLKGPQVLPSSPVPLTWPADGGPQHPQGEVQNTQQGPGSQLCSHSLVKRRELWVMVVTLHKMRRREVRA